MAASDAIDVAGLITAARGVIASGAAAAQQVADTIGFTGAAPVSAASAISADKQGMSDAVDAETQINTLKAAAAAKGQAATAEVASALGTNPDAKSFILTKLGADINSNVSKLIEEQQYVQQQKNTSLLDDPLSWLYNQITLPFNEEALDNRRQSINTNLAVLQGVMARTSEAATTMAIVNQADATSIAALANKATLAKLGSDQAKLDLSLAQLGVNGINIRFAMNEKQVDAMYKINSAQIGIAQLKLSEDAGDRAERTLQLQEEYKQMQMDIKRDDEAAKKQLQDRLTNISVVTNTPQITVQEFNRMPGKQRAMYESLLWDPDIMAGRLGHNMAVSVLKMNETGFGTAGMKYAQSKLMEKGAYQAEQNAGATWAGLKPEQKERLIQEEMQRYVKQEKNIIPDAGGLFSPPPLSTVLSIPAIQGTPLAVALQALAKADPQYPTRAQDVYNAGLQQVIEGKMTPDQVSMNIAAMYKAIAVENSTTRQYGRLAVDELKEKDGFKVPIIVNYQQRSSNQVIDFTKPANITAVLTRAAVDAQAAIRNSGTINDKPAYQTPAQKTQERIDGAK